MKFLIVDQLGNTTVNCLEETCHKCFSNIGKSDQWIICPISRENRRLGTRERRESKIMLCSSKNTTKTTKLFNEKIDLAAYCIPAIIRIKEETILEVSNAEKEKYAKIVHNLKTLNAQSIQAQYKFIPQDKFAENHSNLHKFVKDEIVNRPDDATIALLRLSKNNAHMKTEFSTHEKLSIDNPSLSIQEHNLTKVILNVYHSFDIDFRKKKVAFKIIDSESFVKIDYETVRVAIYHIFSNAIKYIQDKTTLLVEIEERNNQTCVSFNMRSLHICIDEKERIFEDHYSGKSTKAKNKNGNGLGMGLIRKALKINNATIEVICGQKISKQAGQDFSDNIFKLTFLTA